MKDALKTLFVVLTQVPLFGGYWAWWHQVKARPIYAVLISVLYEVFVLLFAFSKKVWGRLEDKAIQSTADWVLAMISSFAPGFQRRYKKQITSDYSVFNVLGLGLINTYRLSLEQVFVNLRIDASNPQQFNVDLTSEKGLAGGYAIWDFFNSDKFKFSEATALSIVGPPGSGKTTLMQHVAITLAANHQRRYKIRSYIPILLFLRDHIKTITQERPPALSKLAQDYFNDADLFPRLIPPHGWFEKQLQRGKCMVILDGLDEVADLEQRKIVSAWVDNQIKNYPRCRFVLTSRPQGYRDAPLQRAHVLEVQPFNANQVRKFIGNWYLANEIISVGGKNDADVRKRASKQASDLMQRLRAAPSLRSLTVNPLLLTMIVMVDRYHGNLPGSRVELYAEICEVLLGRWRQARGVRDVWTAAQKLVVLRYLAAHMMEHKLRDISTTETIEVIAEPLRRVGVKGVATKSFLSDLQANSALLLEREAGRWSFAHLTFQEYLTSTNWLEQKSVKHDWNELVSDSWWGETLRLYAAQGDASPLVRACLSNSSERALMLAADCLDEALEIDPEVRNAAEESVIAALESSDENRRRLAAQVQLSRRLKNLHLTMDDQCEIDIGYLTCAEYQLFVDDMLARHRYHQPDHWTESRFAIGEAQKPVTGLRAEDAVAFCTWLTQRQGDNMLYRLPRPEEARQYESKTANLAAWCSDGKKFSLIGWAEPNEQEVTQQLARLSQLPPLPLYDVSLNSSSYKLALDFAHTFTRALLLMPVFGIELNNELDLRLARYIAIHFDHTLDLNHTRNPYLGGVKEIELGRANAIIYALTQTHAQDLDLDYDYERSYLPTDEQPPQELLGDSGSVKNRLALLLNDLDAIVLAETTASRQAKQKYIVRILEYVYMSYREFLANNHTRQPRQGRPSKIVEDIQKLEPVFLKLYWWLQIIIAREEGKLPAWEGIRIVREQFSEAV